MSRPKVRVPVELVPWASGTPDDLECWRRLQSVPFNGSHYDPRCCRWPKSCSAFDPGFTVGKGPTTLPIVWFDGFGWRSGPPDRSIPQHLFSDIWSRWIEVVRERNLATDPRDYWTNGPGSLPMTSPEEANDDDGNGCGDPGCDCYEGI